MQTAYIRKLLAPIVLSLFAIGWYKFSEIYLVNSDNTALAHSNYAVYVVPQQLTGYLTATLWICYFLVFAGLSVFWYNLVKIVQQLEDVKSSYSIVDVISPIVIAVEIMGFFFIGNSIIGSNIPIRLLGYASVCSCLMWFWYSIVKYVRVKNIV
jgi:hypothetical protein